MNQDSLQRALIALSERSQVSQQLLSSHLQQAEDRLHESQTQLAEVEVRVDRLLRDHGPAAGGTDSRIDAAQTLLQKLDLLEQALERRVP